MSNMVPFSLHVAIFYFHTEQCNVVQLAARGGLLAKIIQLSTRQTTCIEFSLDLPELNTAQYRQLISFPTPKLK